MPGLADLVAAHIERWNTASVEEAVFQTTDPADVAQHMKSFAESVIGSAVRDSVFYGSSAGCIAGLVLEDGQRVVIKAYQRRWGVEFLSAVRRVQELLCDAGFPAPPPIAGPAPTGPALATAEGLLADPGMRRLVTEDEMNASANGLARQVMLCRGLSARALAELHPLRASAGALYPEPHNPIFDFSLQAANARWIDELAVEAKALRDLDDSHQTVIHTDWSARNVRIERAEVVAAYDWDSLAETTESVAVGQAGATWRSTGEASDPIAPGPDEVHAYLSAYEIAIGRPWTPDQRKAALAAALWVLAYTARCEHALEAVTGRRVERARALLADQGRAYLQR